MQEVKPSWCLFENPTGILTLNGGMEFEGVLSALETQGYEVESFIIPAVAVDAPHRRDRVWIVAHSERRRSESAGAYNKLGGPGENPVDVAHTISHPQGKQMGTAGQPWQDASGYAQWIQEPGLGRVALRVPNRTHRIKALGNAVVPQIPEIIGKAIMEI